MVNKPINSKKMVNAEHAHINDLSDAHNTLFEINKEASILFGDEGILDVNLAALGLFSVSSKDALLGLQLADLVPEHQSNRQSSEEYFQKLMSMAFESGFCESTCRLKELNNDEVLRVTVRVNTLLLQQQPIYQITFVKEDSVNNAALNLVSNEGKNIEWHATHDVLTRLPNRTLLKDRFTQAIYSAARHKTLLAVCMLDLDEFKPINDTHGHEVGDQLLIQVAGRIKQGIRQEDTVARLGGDEFVVLIGGIDERVELNRMLERLKTALAEPYQMEGFTAMLSCSIGVSLYPEDQSDADTLLRRADQAMYAAKRAGKNRVDWFDAAKDAQVNSSQQMIARVETALKGNELELYYQPKVNLRTGEILGMEALLRWNHPENGVVPPLDFLPLVEQDDLIVDIGRWVIEQVLKQQVIWLEQGNNWVVSVNIASRHLHALGFYNELKSLLEQYPSVSPEKLEIEILESVGLGDIQRVNELITDCQTLGVKFALDDFGTGYSSLSYLKRLPANTLKIDQTFIRDILDDKDDLALVQAIVGLAKTFNRHVIAEGVETVEHGVLLMRLGCDMVQGYVIAKPMQASELTRWEQAFKLDARWEAWSQWEWDLRSFPLLVAQHDIREWVEQVIVRIEDETLPLDKASISNENNCRFGNWYRTDGLLRYGELSSFKDIDAVHIELHRLGDEVVQLYIDQK